MKVPFRQIQLCRLSYPLSRQLTLPCPLPLVPRGVHLRGLDQGSLAGHPLRLPIGQTAPPAVTPQQWTWAVAADGISVPSDLEGHRNGPGCPF